MTLPAKQAPAPVAGPSFGLGDLDHVPLSDENEKRLEAAMSRLLAPTIYRTRARAELRDAIALSQVSGRFMIDRVFAGCDLRFTVVMDVPVPCKPADFPSLHLSHKVVLGINWPQPVLTQKLPPYAFVNILFPAHDVFHPNVHVLTQALCLGDPQVMPMIGLPVKEILWLTYAGLSGQVVTIDERDPAGVMNAEAARFYQTMTAPALPFTDEPFIRSAAAVAAASVAASAPVPQSDPASAPDPDRGTKEDATNDHGE